MHFNSLLVNYNLNLYTWFMDKCEEHDIMIILCNKQTPLHKN